MKSAFHFILFLSFVSISIASESVANIFREKQLSNNQKTSSDEFFRSYHSHRKRVTNEIMVSGSMVTKNYGTAALSLLVIGVGNANDLDLKRLQTRFHRIVLVDLDEKAMKAGIQRQLGENTKGIYPLSSIDVSSLLTELKKKVPGATWTEQETKRLLSRQKWLENCLCGNSKAIGTIISRRKQVERTFQIRCCGFNLHHESNH